MRTTGIISLPVLHLLPPRRRPFLPPTTISTLSRPYPAITTHIYIPHTRLLCFGFLAFRNPIYSREVENDNVVFVGNTTYSREVENDTAAFRHYCKLGREVRWQCIFSLCVCFCMFLCVCCVGEAEYCG